MTDSTSEFSPTTYQNAARALPSDAIRAQIDALHNSIRHLKRTNDELSKLIQENTDPSEITFLNDTIQENEQAITRQQQRIRLMEEVLRERRELPPESTHYNTQGLYL
jgi:uncharacterized coiled-coil protein SlyX